jgi:nickel superoxide dismutase
MDSGGTGPNRRLSTAPAAGLSDSSHQPPGSRRPARLTSSMPGRAGCRATTIRPGLTRGGRPDLMARRTSSQSPGRSAGSMDRSATATRQIGQRMQPSLNARKPTGYCQNPTSMIRHERRRSMRLLASLLAPKVTAHAHCDLPCGVYDPAQARIEAESVKAICEKYQQNADPEFRARAIDIKEERSDLVKHHLWVLWTDYFKPPHFEKYPQLHELFNQATKLAGAGGTKGSTDPATADELLAKIDEIGKIFWETKQA